MSEPNVIRFTVLGKPQPGGSKKGYGVRGKDGRTHVRIVDANPLAKDWKLSVATCAMESRNGMLLLGGPLRVSMKFFMARPKCHYGTGRNADKLKTGAPAFPTGRPDVLKLARSTEDALTGILWRDDAQTVNLEVHKMYGDPVRCEIEVEST